jgi:hypothetical protein
LHRRACGRTQALQGPRTLRGGQCAQSMCPTAASRPWSGNGHLCATPMTHTGCAFNAGARWWFQTRRLRKNAYSAHFDSGWEAAQIKHDLLPSLISRAHLRVFAQGIPDKLLLGADCENEKGEGANSVLPGVLMWDRCCTRIPPSISSSSKHGCKRISRLWC